MWEQVQEIIINAVLLLVPVLVSYLIAFVKKKTDELQNKINKDEVNKYIDILESTVLNVVTMMEELVVKTAKENNEFTPELGEKVFEEAKESILNILGTSGVEVLQSVYGDLDKMLESLIETAVNKIKPVQG